MSTWSGVPVKTLVMNVSRSLGGVTSLLLNIVFVLASLSLTVEGSGKNVSVKSSSFETILCMILLKILLRPLY